MIKFAHLADLHLGGWREKKLTQLNFITFKLSIEKIIQEKVDFVLFAGDIFNTAIPPIELVEIVVKELMKLKENHIPLYVIGGSHDYSNSGKSFISLLEAAGLFIDVSKYETIDKNKVNLKFHKDKSKTNISGILGKKNGLDKNIYANLNSHNLNPEYFNIFMFHCTLNDIFDKPNCLSNAPSKSNLDNSQLIDFDTVKPDFMKNVNSEIKSNMLPTGFDYYAGGHIHTHIEAVYDKKPLSYPGPLFPNNFRELINEKPSFNLCEFEFSTRETKIKRIFLKTYEKEYIKIEIDNLNPIQAQSKIQEEIENINVEGKIILLEISGVVDGKISDININKIISNLYNNESYCVLKNTYKLTTNQIEKIEISNINNISEIENEIIEKNLEKNENYLDEIKLTKKLLSLDLSKIDEEKNQEYENRIKEVISKTLN